MPSKKARVTLSLDDPEMELLTRLGKFTDLPAASIVNRIFVSRLHDLWEYLTWLEQQTDSRKKSLGANLLISYGPDPDLVNGIRRIDPDYRTMEDQMNDRMNADQRTLDARLAESSAALEAALLSANAKRAGEKS